MEKMLSAWGLLLLISNNQLSMQAGMQEGCAGPDWTPDHPVLTFMRSSEQCLKECRRSGARVADGSLLELSKMIRQVTGKSAIPHYSTYGCYCGLGGQGKPKDLTDWCCWQHDCCYLRVERSGCQPKTDMYRYSFQQGKVRCGNAAGCKQKNCECDRRFVECLQKHANRYRNAYRYFPNFFCLGQAPQCSA